MRYSGLYGKNIVSYTPGHLNKNQLVFDAFDKAVQANLQAYPLFHSIFRTGDGETRSIDDEKTISRVDI